MTSLYKRANAVQRRILRIVEGAVKNALDAHPGAQLPHNFARSVAKRAAGTLTAQWPEVLTECQPSDRLGSQAPKNRPAQAHPCTHARRGGGHPTAAAPPSSEGRA